MMGLAQIRSENEKATRKAKNRGKQPYVAQADHDGGVFNCPRLGDYTPEGWKEVDELFVDMTGFGYDDEPALTKQQFLNKIKEGLGYGISEVGQFQCYIRVFERV
jgi:hypothetical protein